KIRLFLTQFLDHCLENEDYIIKEQHILEKLWDVLFVDAKDKSVFYTDNYSFNKAVFHGNEWLLATFEITVFAFFLALYNFYIFACTATVIISQHGFHSSNFCNNICCSMIINYFSNYMFSVIVEVNFCLPKIKYMSKEIGPKLKL
ncbi:Meckelin, partial [Trachymyrmex zeteki]